MRSIEDNADSESLHRSFTALLESMKRAERSIRTRPEIQPGDLAEGYLNLVAMLTVTIRRAHAVLAEDADEDTLLHWMSCQSIHQFSLAPSAGEYVRGLRDFPQLPSYQFVADIYKYLQWQDGGKRKRRWVMKSPNHLGCLEEVLAVHPKASFIYLIRDYRAAFASMCKLMEVHYKNTFKDMQPEVLGSVLLEFWAREMRCHRQQRQRLGDRLRMLELDYRDLIADPLPSIGAAYQLAGMELTPAGETAIRHWLAQNPQGKYGKFEYDLARYGIRAEAIDDVFGRVAEESV
jgi:hypothetical protein